MNKVKLFRFGDKAYDEFEDEINQWLAENTEGVQIHKMYLTGEPQTFFIWYSQHDKTKK